MRKHAFFFSAIIVLVLTAAPSSVVLAVSDPYIIEEYDSYYYRLEYTVANPGDSSVGDIVGFVIEVDYSYWLEASAENGWMAQGTKYSPIDSGSWDSTMAGGEIFLTWREFFGGIDYPFGDTKAVGYFVNYSETSPGVFEFDFSVGTPPYHLPVLPGESLGGFYAEVDGPASQFVLAHIGDSENGTFDNTGLPSLQGETIPEPATLLLLGLGGLGLIRKHSR